MEFVVKHKVCEACGKMFFRAQGDAGPYCQRCNVALKAFPAPITHKKRGHRSRAETLAAVKLDLFALKMFHARY